MQPPTPAAKAALTPLPFAQLLERAQAGDETVLPELRRQLAESPELWQRCGDLAQHAEVTWLQLIAGRDLFLQESVRRKLDDLKHELLGDSPTPLERLLAERLAVAWLERGPPAW
ncbi:MAG: hypothetical protein JNM56_32080 [Planctomycetia bacterium]|nr:hypothetical protein [Planctomycetia bacterium]